jgi:hypothetical protein
VNAALSKLPRVQQAFNDPAGLPLVNSPVCGVW